MRNWINLIEGLSLDRENKAPKAGYRVVRETGVVNVPVSQIYPFAVHQAAQNTQVDASREEENNRLAQYISQNNKVLGSIVVTIDIDRKRAYIADGNHRSVMAYRHNPNMLVPVRFQELTGLSKGLPSASDYDGRFDRYFK